MFDVNVSRDGHRTVVIIVAVVAVIVVEYLATA